MNKINITHHLVSVAAVTPLLLITVLWGVAEPDMFNPWAAGLEFWKIMLPAALASLVVPLNALIAIVRARRP